MSSRTLTHNKSGWSNIEFFSPPFSFFCEMNTHRCLWSTLHKQSGHAPYEDEVFLPEEPSVKRYSPVYSPDTGRVKIKLIETPKPKTPMLVTRSRSNAGAYITTPNLNIRSTAANGQ